MSNRGTRLLALSVIALVLVVAVVWQATRERRSDGPPPSSPAMERIDTLRREGNVEGLARETSAADVEVARRAAASLGYLGAEAVPHLEQALKDSRHEVREAAAVALGRTAAADPVSLLGTAAREDPSANVRAAAVTALGKVRAVSEMDAILGALDDEDQTVRERASAAVTRILGRRYETYLDGSPKERHQAVEALRQAFHSEMEPHVRDYYARWAREKEP
jgi:HEAT repeat protein